MRIPSTGIVGLASFGLPCDHHSQVTLLVRLFLQVGDAQIPCQQSLHIALSTLSVTTGSGYAKI
jgi:hypothetical protein